MLAPPNTPSLARGYVRVDVEVPPITTWLVEVEGRRPEPLKNVQLTSVPPPPPEASLASHKSAEPVMVVQKSLHSSPVTPSKVKSPERPRLVEVAFVEVELIVVSEVMVVLAVERRPPEKVRMVEVAFEGKG